MTPTQIRSLTLNLAFVLLCSQASTASAAQAPRPDGAQTYARFCAACHDQTTPRIPPRDALTGLSPQRIMRTLDFGLMMSVAYPMRRDEREAVAAFLGKGMDNQRVDGLGTGA
jgi:mono/diheme cytochrome c family protein